MPTLYTMPGTCALAPNIAAAWIDAPVEVKVLARGDQKKDAYLSINPKGKVPALQMDDGEVLTEAAAIMAWLGATYGGEGYARDERLGRKEAEALSWMTTEVHGAFRPHFAPDAYADSEAAQKEVLAKTYARLDAHFARMDDILARAGEWYLGERSFADAYLYTAVRWLDLVPLSLDDYPALRAHRDRMEADADVRMALARQKMDPQT